MLIDIAKRFNEISRELSYHLTSISELIYNSSFDFFLSGPLIMSSTDQILGRFRGVSEERSQQLLEIPILIITSVQFNCNRLLLKRYAWQLINLINHIN